MVLASITIFLGSAVALVQTDIKRRLAYSSIDRWICVAGNQPPDLNGLTGTIFHILAHALMKSALFMCAGAIIFKTGKREISELSGIGYEMPITLSVFTVASLSMIGIPPFNGFISKLVLSLGALDAGKAGFVVLLIVSSLLNGIYFLPIVINGFLGVKKEQRIWPKPFAELKASMWIPLVILAVLCGIFSVLPVNYPLGWAEAAARMLTGAVK